MGVHHINNPISSCIVYIVQGGKFAEVISTDLIGVRNSCSAEIALISQIHTRVITLGLISRFIYFGYREAK